MALVLAVQNILDRYGLMQHLWNQEAFALYGGTLSWVCEQVTGQYFA